MNSLQQPNPPCTIAVVGTHYVGKSTVSQLLKEHQGFEIVRENWDECPFLENPEDVFKRQIWFLTETANALTTAREMNASGKSVVLDTFLYSTLVFSESVMEENDLRLFQELFQLVEHNASFPDMLLYLYADPKYLYDVRRPKRIEENTGPGDDSSIPFEWLQKVNDLNHKYFDSWKKTKIVRVDTSTVNFLEDEKAFQDLYVNILKTLNE